jgi:2',3'-cyclic-nucleotide 2'-phosphodiesterase (5'-nucleotidase family)
MQRMKRVNFSGALLLGLLLFACGQSRYTVQSIEGSRIEMDSLWDSGPSEMAALVASYKVRLDEQMRVPLGVAAQTLYKRLPQSPLSNFTADALLHIGQACWGAADFALMNMGGLRAPLPQGPITVGHLYETYPFENRIVLLDLPGAAVRELFAAIAARGGQGVSGTVCLIICQGAVDSLAIGGHPVDEARTYRVVTLDYLAEGNDGMEALRQATRIEDSHQPLRAGMMEYIQSLTAHKTPLNATIDRRITICP